MAERRGLCAAADSPKESFKMITKPFDFRKQVQEQIAIAQAVK